jgi:hypothetical protein
MPKQRIEINTKNTATPVHFRALFPLVASVKGGIVLAETGAQFVVEARSDADGLANASGGVDGEAIVGGAVRIAGLSRSGSLFSSGRR